MRAETRGSEFIDAYAIGKGFGSDKGDKVVLEIPVSQIPQKGVIGIRFRLKENTKLAFLTSGIVNQPITFEGSGKFDMLYVPYDVNNSKQPVLELISQGGNGIDINGFFLGEETLVRKITVVANNKNFTPVEASEGDKDLRLKFDPIDCHYGLAWDFEPSQKRRMLNDELDIFFRKFVHEHVSTMLTGNKQGFFSNIFMRPVDIAPQSKTVVYWLICKGNETGVKQSLAAFNSNPKAFVSLVKTPENSFNDILPEGKKYEFSQTMLRATVLSNVVYPVYTQGQFIRHFTPGKWWNSLYTWDSGFEALGLAEIDLKKAIENLNAYTTPVGSQSAFIHHGSMVPVQMYAFYDIWNKTQSKEYLEYFYPRLKQYYEFFAGKAGNSSTALLNSKLLKTWDYWGNSGGWDDYPPQVYVNWKKMGHKTSPVISTSNAIRIAKILRMSAEKLGIKTDVKEYDKDIALFSNALQNHSWDKASGYFSYVVHDTLGNPKEFLRHEPSGANYNMGLDGAYPLFAGICTKQQEDTLLDKIFSDKHMWTKAGLGVVDQAAPYYRHDGYWNGTVWMPHQWFIWKTMFDLGRADLAWKIAERGLDVYSRETNESYFTFEHFISKSTRGAGWHQFAGLSTPVLMWFSAYYKPGTVTTGFETWIDKQAFAPNNEDYEATLSFDNATVPHSRSMVVVLNPAFDYQVLLNGKPVDFMIRHKGVVEVKLPASNKACNLSIKRIN